MNPSPVSAELLDRYFTGRCTPDETLQMKAAIAQNPTLSMLQQGVDGEHIDVASAWTRLLRSHWMKDVEGGFSWRGAGPQGRQFLPGGVFKAQPLPVGRPSGRHGAWGGAWIPMAVMALGVVAVVTWWGRGVAHAPAHHQTAVSTYTTGNGERATITLPDDNTVTLNVASRLQVPMDYSAGDHALRLTGEALFTVQHHTTTPFTVMAGPTTTRVLGTSFVVRRYLGDTTTMVAVREGRVAVQTLTLAADQVVEIGPTGPARIQSAGTAPFSFAAGVLTLDALPLSDAMPLLNRWYDADLRLGDPTLSQQRLTGNLPAGSLAELAQDLEVTLHVRVVREGRVLTLWPR